MLCFSAAQMLTVRTSDNALTLPVLNSGLYLFPSPTAQTDNAPQYYLVYWPEETTWLDKAPSHIVKNRITFIRYLTKLCDQLLVYIDEQVVDSLVLTSADDDSDDEKEDEDEDEDEQMKEDEDIDSSSRMYKFNVKKTHEQSETVTPFPGFKVQKLFCLPCWPSLITK